MIHKDECAIVSKGRVIVPGIFNSIQNKFKHTAWKFNYLVLSLAQPNILILIKIYILLFLVISLHYIKLHIKQANTFSPILESLPYSLVKFNLFSGESIPFRGLSRDLWLHTNAELYTLSKFGECPTYVWYWE